LLNMMSKFTYRIVSFLAIFYVLVLSIFQLLSEVRAFSIIHIICCVALLISFRYRLKLYLIILKIWCIILFVSGFLVLLSSILYFTSGNGDKISVSGNVLAVIFTFISVVLFKYRDKFVTTKNR